MIRWILIPAESGGGGCGCMLLFIVILIPIGLIASCYDYFVTQPQMRTLSRIQFETAKKRDDEKIQRAASVGAVDLEIEVKRSGFDSLSDLTQFGNHQLRDKLQRATDELRQAKQDYDRANAINQPDIQLRINEAQTKITGIEREIKVAQAAIARQTYLRTGYTFSTLNEQRDGGQSSCTIRIPTVLNGGFADTKVSLSVPDVTLVGEVGNYQQDRNNYIEFNVSGSTESLKELVNNTESYQATILFNNPRHNSNSNSVEADILSIDIVKLQ